jgi:DNA-binding NarL/FixJ family response regulator
LKKILIATIQPILAQGFESILTSAGFEVSALCFDAPDMHGCFLKSPPDVAFVDYSLLPGPGIIADLMKAAPRCHLIIVARELHGEVAKSLMGMGVYGIIAPTVATPDLLTLVALLMQKDRTAAAIPSAQVRELLSPSERKFVSLVAQGIQDKEIAALMRCTEREVSSLRRQVSQRLQVEGRCELALYGLAAKAVEA